MPPRSLLPGSSDQWKVYAPGVPVSVVHVWNASWVPPTVSRQLPVAFCGSKMRQGGGRFQQRLKRYCPEEAT